MSRQGRPHGSSDGAEESERAGPAPPSLFSISPSRPPRAPVRTRRCVRTAPRATGGGASRRELKKRGRAGGHGGHRAAAALSLMILPQVHLRKPCYDFYFL